MKQPDNPAINYQQSCESRNQRIEEAKNVFHKYFLGAAVGGLIAMSSLGYGCYEMGRAYLSARPALRYRSEIRASLNYLNGINYQIDSLDSWKPRLRNLPKQEFDSFYTSKAEFAPSLDRFVNVLKDEEKRASQEPTILNLKKTRGHVFDIETSWLPIGLAIMALFGSLGDIKYAKAMKCHDETCEFIDFP